MSHQPYQPWIEPGAADWERMSPEDSRRFLKQFRERAQERAEAIVRAIQSTPGFADYSGDYTERSLLRMGEWVKATFRTEKRLPQRVDVRGPMPVAVARDLAEMYQGIPETWVVESQSVLIVDLGFYVAICLLRRFPWLKWKRCSAPSSPWFNQPCLPAYGNHGFAPVFEARVMAYAIAESRVGVGGFAEMADRWSREYVTRTPRH